MYRAEHSTPSFAVPEGACDCHMHIFGAREIYPYAARRTYTPLPAPLADYLKMARTIGLVRTILVQPSAYGVDNSCLLDVLRQLGPAARGVVGIDAATTEAELDAMNGLGVRGVRLNMASSGRRDVREIATLVERTAGRIAPLGWHLQLFTDLAVIDALAGVLKQAAVPIVIDHMGLAQCTPGTRQASFATLIGLMSGGRCWVKLSGAYRISSDEPDFPDAEPIARALIAANPQRVVWGTDWPHTGRHGHAQESEPPPIEYRPLDDGRLIDLLAQWTDSDAASLRRILVGNPAELYAF
jgi:predicted TIM-barrel fold metal-dependent hydrolase